MSYSQQQLSLLRRHHTLSTTGPRLARLEKQQAFANMPENDRRFYGGGGSEAGSSLSGSESLESLSFDTRSNLCLTPILQSSQQSATASLMPELSDHPLLHKSPSQNYNYNNNTQNSSPPATRNPLAAPTTAHQSGFQLIRGYKGAAPLRSLDLGSPVELTGEEEGHEGQTEQHNFLVRNHQNPKTWIQSAHSQARPLLNPNIQLPTLQVEPPRTGTETASQSGSFPLYTQATLHRNFSSPSKLQHSSSSFPNNRINEPFCSPSDWNKLSILNRTMKSTQSALLQPIRSQTLDDSIVITTEELVDEQVMPSPVDFPQTSNLHRATSDRVSSTGNQLNASQPPSSNTLSHWSEQTNLRRHQSMKSDGRWGTSVVTHFDNKNNSETRSTTNDPVQLQDSTRNQYDSSVSFSEIVPSIGGPSSTTLLRSSSHHSNPSSVFSNPMSTHPSPTGNIGQYSSQASGVVTTMSSPVSVPGLSINPWSPSVEEAKKLREPMLRQASLDTLASNNSSNHIPHHPMKNNNHSDLSRFRSTSNDDTQGREMNLLHTTFGRMNLVQGKNGEELNSRSAMGLSHRISGVKSPLSTSTSLADFSDGATADDAQAAGPAVVAPSKKVVLPPLVTDFSRDTLLAGAAQARKAPGSIKRHPNGVPLLFQGPASAAAFVPPIGHSLSRNVNDPFNFQEKMALVASHNTAAPGIGASTWLTQKERLIGESQSRQQSGEWPSSLPHSPSSQLPTATTSVSNLPQQIQQQIIINQQLQQLQQLQVQQHQLQQQQTQLLSSTMRLPVGSNGNAINGFNSPSMANILQSNAFAYSNMSPSAPGSFFGAGNNPHLGPTPPPNPSRLQTTITGLPGLGSLSGTSPHVLPSSSVGGIPPMTGPNIMNMTKPMPFINPGLIGANNQSIQELALQKGYNPTHFDTSPPSARFFVIKSYTEEDVHKSLKYEIWASTDLGNKRLDRAFQESHESGPIYLLFSVNASGHFCGMAEMLTAVDYNTSSKVWAQDKWKGIFKVRWVFVKDIPNNALRHIKLTNTPENKPITSSRDTQEVPHDKGIQVLHIMSTYQSRTTLLQDYAWYEHNESQKSQNQPAVTTETSAPVTNAEPSRQSSSPPASSSASSGRQPRHNVQNNQSIQNQNIRWFTQANGHPTRYTPVPVQVVSGI
ncbi:hypothetical protein VP01_875g5 [Puccinia sorghi]|uniref:YTH domain-containing protein n=1 Tax=Puccinia sorghi TaxID=27349 RepID=A0A0L6UAQ9_9BASI|nr:hypothetical protein VP01_875g5 [Puccinia sorghi]